MMTVAGLSPKNTFALGVEMLRMLLSIVLRQ